MGVFTCGGDGAGEEEDGECGYCECEEFGRLVHVCAGDRVRVR